MGLVVGSLDNKALYPSLEIIATSEICARLIATSGVKFEGVDWAWACKFVALAMEEDDVIRKDLQDIIPRRRAKSGKKPTLRTVETDDKKER